MAYKRPDGRNYDETRKIEAKVGIIKRADGSAMFSFGNSKAIVAVYGPRQLHPQHLQNPEKCLLRCYYDMMSFSVAERKRPGPTRRSTEVSYVTSNALKKVLKLEDFPNSVIDVYILIVEADASTRCAGINAASMALAHAGIPMKELVSSISIGKIGDAIVADLTKEEEDYSIKKDGKEIKAATDIPFAFQSRSGKISLMQLDGKVSIDDLKRAISLGKKMSKKIIEIQTQALKKVKEDKK
ncbi:MAG: exosome complex exonuclease Rrp41 [Candidatus Pacearchaeota archaeon]|nr:MAG: exosome complex exonuclease Rrp41 [Candidatus Pacearchaeota archaeon]